LNGEISKLPLIKRRYKMKEKVKAMLSPAVGYIRVQADAKPEDIELQRETLITLIQAEGYQATLFLTDTCGGNDPIEKRPGLEQLLQVKNTSIFVTDVSRITREPNTSSTLKNLIKNGNRIFTKSGELTLISMSFFEGLADLAQEEEAREKKRRGDRIREGKARAKQRREQGLE
jgi:DNA invertase Pin-like site-specific DNA recombinase